MDMERWKNALRFLGIAVRRPAYNISLVIALTTALVTWDAQLVIWTACSGLLIVIAHSLIAHVKSRRMPPPQPQTASALMSWDHAALLGASAAGVVLMVLFGFGKHVFFRVWPELSSTEAWETGALIWTGICWLVYCFKLQTKLPAWLQNGVLLVFAAAGGYCGYRALTALTEPLAEPLAHVWWVWAISGVLLATDLFLFKFHKEPASQSSFLRSAMIADLPIVIGFFVLIVYVLKYPDAEDPKAFLSGAISLQFIVTNVIFVVSWTGLIDRGKP